MTIHQLLDALTASIPVVLFLSVIVGLVLFVKYKGTIDALKDAASTYEQVAGAYKEQVEQLKLDIIQLQAEIAELNKTICIQKEAINMVTEDIYNLVVTKLREV